MRGNALNINGSDIIAWKDVTGIGKKATIVSPPQSTESPLQKRSPDTSDSRQTAHPPCPLTPPQAPNPKNPSRS